MQYTSPQSVLPSQLIFSYSITFSVVFPTIGTDLKTKGDDVFW